MGSFLHRLYYKSSGLTHFLMRRTRPAGIGLSLVILLSICLMGQRGRATYQLFSLTLGMTMISIPWALARRVELQAKRILPRYGTVGEPLCYTISVTHSQRRKISRAWLVEPTPDARPSREDFRELREPGEEERNAFDRYFAYYRWQWLMVRNLRFRGGDSGEELQLAQGEMKQVALEITPLRRGLIHFQDLRVALPDPFGLFQGYRLVKNSAASLTVLPRRYRTPRLRLPGKFSPSSAELANTNSLGDSGEFLGLRDYRPGDPIRQIHWRSWARTGRPIVKELEKTTDPGYSLIVDIHQPRDGESPFEELISVAASFISPIDGSESLIDSLWIADQYHRATALSEQERAAAFLEILAVQATSREENFKALAERVRGHRGDFSSCIIILNGWDSIRADFVQSLERHGFSSIVFIIGKGPAPAKVPGYWLETGKIAQDLLHLPSQISTGT
jgi:uncharacterized protein (DUF58 family)